MAEGNGEGASGSRQAAATDALDYDSDITDEADDPVMQHNRDRALLDDDFLDAPEAPP